MKKSMMNKLMKINYKQIQVLNKRINKKNNVLFL